MPQPLVHVLVINWNGLEHLEACFASLLQSTYPNARFVLVDNGSTDASVAYVREHFGHDARVEFLECGKNLGWSGGNNAGMIRALDAGADYIFLLNNDTATEADAIERLVDMAEAGPQVGALAPKMLMFHTPEILNSLGLLCSRIGACWDRGIGRLDGPVWDTATPVIGVCGGAMFLRATALRQTGLLPEDFEIYLDDLDLCLRLWSAGYEIWTCPEARVRHKFSATLGTGARARHKYYLNTRNRFRVLLRNFPVGHLLRSAHAIAWGEAKAVGSALRVGDFRRVICHLRAWIDAVCYARRAWRVRQSGLRNEQAAGRFLPLVIKSPLFCPGVLFPESGWYPPRTFQGHELRPMSARAWVRADGARLRVFHVNCYPRLGETHIRVTQGGNLLCELRTSVPDECMIAVSPGRVEFEALNLFSADETGELVDLGGWLELHPETENPTPGDD